MLAYGTMKTALYLHHNLLHCILGAGQDFFDTTPKGRIISRFSTDINTIDYNLPMSIRQIMNVFFRVGAINRANKKNETKALIITINLYQRGTCCNYMQNRLRPKSAISVQRFLRSTFILHIFFWLIFVFLHAFVRQRIWLNRKFSALICGFWCIQLFILDCLYVFVSNLLTVWWKYFFASGFDLWKKYLEESIFSAHIRSLLSKDWFYFCSLIFSQLMNFFYSFHHFFCSFLPFFFLFHCTNLPAISSIMCDALPRLACLCAAIKIHYALLTGISHAPLSFFDRTPSGRILARFSKDLEVLDTEIPTLLCDLLSTAFEVIATLSLSHAQKNAKFFLLKKNKTSFLAQSKYQNLTYWFQ